MATELLDCCDVRARLTERSHRCSGDDEDDGGGQRRVSVRALEMTGRAARGGRFCERDERAVGFIFSLIFLLRNTATFFFF